MKNDRSPPGCIMGKITVLQEACIIPDEESGKKLGLLREGNFSVSRPAGRRRFRKVHEGKVSVGAEREKVALLHVMLNLFKHPEEKGYGLLGMA